MFCNTCGADNNPGNSACIRCGTEFSPGTGTSTVSLSTNTVADPLAPDPSRISEIARPMSGESRAERAARELEEMRRERESAASRDVSGNYYNSRIPESPSREGGGRSSLHFYTRMSAVMGSLVLFYLLFRLLVTFIDLSQAPAIVFGTVFFSTLGISYYISRFFMVKFTDLNGLTIIAFILFTIYTAFFNNGNIAPRISIGDNPIMAIIGLCFIVGLFYYVTGWLFENSEDNTT